MMTDAKSFVFDKDTASHIYSVSPVALAEMATSYAQASNVNALQAVIDAGLLDVDDKPMSIPVSRRLARAICPLMFREGFESRPELFTDWLSRCAKSCPDQVAGVVYEMVSKDKIKDSSVAGLLGACGLGLTSPMEAVDIVITGNNHQEYAMQATTLGGMLLMCQPACMRTLIDDMSLAGTLDDIPVLARSKTRDGKDHDERVLNLLDVALLGNGPNDPETAVESFSLALSMLDMSQWHVREALTDALVRADKFDFLNAEGMGEPLNLIALAIDAGCELEGRKDLVAGRGFQPGEDQRRLPLLHCLACANPKRQDQDHLPSNKQSINAARRVIVEGGADPNEYSVHGQTALHYAIMHNNPPMVEMLLANGADPKKTQQSNNANAVELALERGFYDIAQMIPAWEAKQAIASVLANAKAAVAGGAAPC